jgi:hypothetical protein
MATTLGDPLRGAVGVMATLLDTVASWQSLLLVLVVFGFAPGFCLRLIVLAYPRNDPRRSELPAELYAVPTIKRPLWVAMQLEVALFEGLGHRGSTAIRRLHARRRASRRTEVPEGSTDARDEASSTSSPVMFVGVL